MSDIRPSRDLIGKPIISMTNGVSIGKVVDILFDPDAAHVAALVTSKGGLLARGAGMEAIPAQDVQVWGQDAVLVSRPDVVTGEDQLPERQHWLSVVEQVKGRDVVSIDGTRIGQLNDIVLNTQGELVAYDLAHVLVSGPVTQSKRIPAQTTRSFGRDVLIVDKLQADEAPAEELPPEA
jgi:uncharacterized protein YrrD